MTLVSNLHLMAGYAQLKHHYHLLSPEKVGRNASSDQVWIGFITVGRVLKGLDNGVPIIIDLRLNRYHVLGTGLADANIKLIDFDLPN